MIFNANRLKNIYRTKSSGSVCNLKNNIIIVMIIEIIHIINISIKIWIIFSSWLFILIRSPIQTESKQKS